MPRDRPLMAVFSFHTDISLLFTDSVFCFIDTLFINVGAAKYIYYIIEIKHILMTYLFPICVVTVEKPHPLSTTFTHGVSEVPLIFQSGRIWYSTNLCSDKIIPRSWWWIVSASVRLIHHLLRPDYNGHDVTLKVEYASVHCITAFFLLCFWTHYHWWPDLS